jgi:hypothetical protein
MYGNGSYIKNEHWRKVSDHFKDKIALFTKLETSMNDDTTYAGIDALDSTDSSLSRTYTQVASCAFSKGKVERRRQSLRAKLERERYERQQKLDQSFISTFRNFISSVKH